MSTKRNRANLRRILSPAAMTGLHERFEATFEHAPIGLAHVAPDGAILRANGHLCGLLGIGPAAAVGLRWQEAVDPEGWRDDAASLARVLAGDQESCAGERCLTRADGTPFWARLTATRVGRRAQDCRCFLFVLEDISEQRRMGEALAAGEARTRALFEQASEAITVSDAGGVFLEVNARACELLGYTRGELLGRFSRDLIDETHLARTRWRFDEVLAGAWVMTERPLRRGDGTLVWAELSTKRLTDGRVECILRDITARLRAEEERAIAEDALRQSQRLFERMAAATPDILYVLDLQEGRCVWVNAGAGRVLGYTPAQVARCGHGFSGLPLHPDDLERALDDLRGLDALADGEVLEHEFRMRHADGTWRWMQARNAVFERNEAGRATRMVGQAQDVTGRRRAEQERREEAARRFAFMRDVLASVTDGHLLLCQTGADLPALLVQASAPVPLSTAAGLRGLRHAAWEACRTAGLPEDRAHDMMTAASEAGMNAIVHVGKGVAQVSTDPESGRVQVRVVDQGPGIAFADLPSATLMRGYSSAGTLGHGMKMMLQTADRVFLLTGTGGTTVVLEQDRSPGA